MSNLDKKYLERICNQFIDELIISIEPYGDGLVNRTYLVITEDDHRYIMQKISKAFENPASLMQNYAIVTETIASRLSPPARSINDCRIQHVIRTQKGALPYFRNNEDGSFWRMKTFVPNSIYPDEITDEVFKSAGKAFGEFQALTSDLADKLDETIPNFHNTAMRFKQLLAILPSCPPSLLTKCHDDIGFIFARSDQLMNTYDKITANPQRVVHNDTKLNNVLFDKKTLEYLCVIDLDTVMPGYPAYDFGDAIRFGANSTDEDSPNLKDVHLKLDLFEAFTKGYLGSATFLTPEEISTLVDGCWIITLELAIRFLTDYLDGNQYFQIDYPDHNLIRTCNQLALLDSIEQNRSSMEAIIAKHTR